MRSIAIIAIVVAIGFSFAACSDGGGGTPPPVTIGDNFVGTWRGMIGSYTTTIIVTNTTWTQYVSIYYGSYYYDSGYFTSWNGTSGNIYSDAIKKVVGTATVTDATHAIIVLNSNAEYPGTYYFTK